MLEKHATGRFGRDIYAIFAPHGNPLILRDLMNAPAENVGHFHKKTGKNRS